MKYLPFLIVSLIKQVSARVFDALARQFTVRPTSRARFLDENCHQLTDIQTKLRPTTQRGRSPATFDLRSQVAGEVPVTALSVALAVASSACRSVGRKSQFSSRLEINSRSVGLTVHSSAGVSRNSPLTYRPTEYPVNAGAVRRVCPILELI